MAEKVELRGMCPIELAHALDAIAMAKGMDRNAYVIQVLTGEVTKYLHETMIVHKALRGNPLLPDEQRKPGGR